MARPLVTILTACLPASSLYLKETAESVASLREALPELDFQWVVVFDGPEQVETPAGADLAFSTPKHRGVAAARNYGLTKATGEYLINLDADDLIYPEAVQDAIARLQADKDLGWVACNRLLLSGDKTVHWHEEERVWLPGRVAEEWSAPMAFHSNTLVVRTELVRLAGGTPALGVCQDLGLCLTLSELRKGVSVSSVLIGYRAWEGQNTATAGIREEQTIAYDFIVSSLNLLRGLFGRVPVQRPVALAGLGSKKV